MPAAMNHRTSAGTTPMSPEVTWAKKDESGSKGMDELLMSNAALVHTPAVPSVVMKEGTRSPTVIRPLSAPIAPPTARHTEPAAKGSRPPSASFAMTIPLKT